VPALHGSVLFLTPAGRSPRHCCAVITREQFDAVAGPFEFLRCVVAAALEALATA